MMFEKPGKYGTTTLNKKNKLKSADLLTIISSPSPVARQSDPATLVAIFSRGRVTIGKPAHSISVPVVCALHKGLKVYSSHI